jgi:hypothetical protein
MSNKNPNKDGKVRVSLDFKPAESELLENFRKKCFAENRDLTKGIKQAMSNYLKTN